jgi:predicted acyltransferase
MTATLTAPRSIERPAVTPVVPAPPRPAEKPPRLVSLDAYRGFIMLVMASAGFGFTAMVKKPGFHDSALWQTLAYEFDHVKWVGCSFWDLIQPSFIFMVGVAMPYSYAGRVAKGESDTRIYLHAVWRAFLLVALAIFLSSPLVVKISYPALSAAAGATGRMVPAPAPTNFIFTNVLAQIGLGYMFVFLLRGRGWKVQLAALGAILAGYTLLFGLHPLPGADFDYRAVGVDEGWPHLTGWFAHWDKNANAAAAFDVWFMNLFPRPVPFVYNEGGYATLNFVPSMATMLLGLMAGELLRGPKSNRGKFVWLVAAGAVCLVTGLIAGQVVCPIVKRIWTPSWALFSAGWTFWMLAAFFGAIDVAGWKRWAWPLTVVGMNSIAMYCMSQLLKGWVAGRLKMHLVPEWFEGTYGPVVTATAVLFVLWLVCVWLWRRGIFLRI